MPLAVDIGFSSIFPDWPIELQFPGRRCIWGSYRWHINPERESPGDLPALSYWVVYENLPVEEAEIFCPPENTVFVAGEQYNHYDQEFLNQFGTVISHFPLKHSNLVRSIPGSTWHVVRKVGIDGKPDTFPRGYNEIAVTHPTKTKLLSVIASTKVASRLAFACKIKERFKESCDLFGWGVQLVEDKWEAIAPYKYHVVIENQILPYWLTEKLTDCYLAESFPFYRGCPNVNEFFPGCIVLPEDDDLAVDYIAKCITAGVYVAESPTLLKCKELVLNKYNMFPLIIDIIEKRGLNPSATPLPVTLHRNRG